MPTTDIVLALLVLLPGFLAARVFGSLVARKPPDAVERLIEALIFELVVVAAYGAVASFWPALQPKDLSALAAKDSAEQFALDPLQAVRGNAVPFAALVSLSLAVGFGASVAHNHDVPWSLLRRLKLTKQSSRATVWGGVFQSYANYIIVHLNDGTRILGWPRHYSDSAEEGEIFLEKARYLSDTGQVEDEVVVDGPGVLLTKAAGISHVEFLRPTASSEEDSHGEADDPPKGGEEPASS